MPVKTEWKVERKGPATKIKASCPVCKSAETFHGEPGTVVRQTIRHSGCKGPVERIPTEIRDLYWQRAVVSEN